MEGGDCGKWRNTIEGDMVGTSSKRQKKAMHEEGEESYMSCQGAHVVDVGDEGEDVSSSSRSKYMAEESGGQSSSGDSVSLEVELQFVEDVAGDSASDMEERRSRRVKRRSNVPKVDVVWKSFEEAGTDGLIWE